MAQILVRDGVPGVVVDAARVGVSTSSSPTREISTFHPLSDICNVGVRLSSDWVSRSLVLRTRTGTDIPILTDTLSELDPELVTYVLLLLVAMTWSGIGMIRSTWHRDINTRVLRDRSPEAMLMTTTEWLVKAAAGFTRAFTRLGCSAPLLLPRALTAAGNPFVAERNRAWQRIREAAGDARIQSHS